MLLQISPNWMPKNRKNEKRKRKANQRRKRKQARKEMKIRRRNPTNPRVQRSCERGRLDTGARS